MVSILEAIVVEGRYDKNALAQIVDAPIFVTDGFRIFHDPRQLALLRAAAEKRGLIVFTDADGAGLVIRNYLKGAIDNRYLKHAYTPAIMGKERRKAAPGRAGLLGVEGMDPETLIDALRRAGATFQEGAAARQGLTKQDLMALGLSGGPNSAEKRRALAQKLGLPGNLSSNALLQALDLLMSREELAKLAGALEKKP